MPNSIPFAFALVLSLSLGVMMAVPVVPTTQDRQVNEQAVDRAPTLLAQTEEGGVTGPVAIDECEITIDIQGVVAKTTTTLTFRNDLDRVLEGQFFFPIPDRSTIVGYALDVEGELVDAVPVEQQAARMAFESEVRKGIDPGLLEWQRGNNFSMRVWPIPAKGARTVRISYVSQLPAGADGRRIYHLPLHYRMPMDRFELSIAAHGVSGVPEVLAGEVVDFRFDQARDLAMAEVVLNDVAPEEDVRIAVPVSADQFGITVYAQFDSATGNTFFAAAVPATANVPVAKPDRIAVIWDASLSGANSRDAELDVLAQHIEKLGSVTVDLLILRNVVEENASFRIHDSDASALIRLLRGTASDGGTSFADLSIQSGDEIDYAILFSDGVRTIGDDLPVLSDAPVFTVSNAAQSDTGFLRHLASVTGGAHFNLLGGATVEGAAKQIGRPMSLISVTSDLIDQEDLLARTESSEQAAIILGRFSGERAVVNIAGPDGGASSFHVEAGGSEVESDGAIRYLWAMEQVERLAIQPEKNHQALVEIGREFNIITPGTSLLVLETLEQYLTYGIEPPRSRSEMRDQYLAQIKARDDARIASRAEKLDRVAAAWAERVAWWNRDFKYADNFRYRAESEGRDGAVSGEAPAPQATRPATDDLRVAEQAQSGRPARSPSGGEGGGGFGGGVDESVLELGAELADGQGGEAGTTSPGFSITINEWNPDTPYLKALASVSERDRYEVYLAQRMKHGGPGFFLDCADFFWRHDQRPLAVRVLTNVAELRIDDPRLLRVLAYRLEQYGRIDDAIKVFEKVRRLRPEEPQSHRDLALALVLRADYERALELLEQVVVGDWDGRFSNIELIALNEFNHILHGLNARVDFDDDSIAHDDRLMKHLPVDVRIAIQWDTDLTDIDLWVTEPSGEKCDYSHNRTTIGGMMTDDYTQGYGPEVYLLKSTMPGTYTIQAHFYGSSQQALTGPTTVRAVVVTNFGRPDQERKVLTLRLDKPDEVFTIGEIAFDG